MGQKVIPTSLRLNKNKNWSSEWFIDKSDYPNYLHFDLSINTYIQTILENDCKVFIKKNFTTTNIYVYFVRNNNKIQKKEIQKNLNLIFNKNIKLIFIKLNIKFLQKRKKKQFSKLLRILKKKQQYISELQLYKMIFFTKNISFLSTLITKNIEKTPKHLRYIKSLEKILNFFFNSCSGILGYKIQFKGRLNGKKRSQKKIIQGGRIPLSTLQNEVLYDFKEALTPYGICGVKVWLFIYYDVSKSNKI